MLPPRLLVLLLILSYTMLHSSQDSIFIRAKLASDLKTLSVSQELKLTNTLGHKLEQVKLLNWITAYRREKTPLAKRKLEDRIKNLYFSTPEQWGYLKSLKINNLESGLNLEEENLYLPLKQKLSPSDTLRIRLDYDLLLPDAAFTTYGTTGEGVNLKYFFLVPDGLETEKQTPRFFTDTEELQSGNIYWHVEIEVPEGFYTESNLKKEDTLFLGISTQDPEFCISKIPSPKIMVKSQEQNIDITFGFLLNDEEKANLEFFLPLHLSFIGEKIGTLPEKLFISEKFKKQEDFFGKKDIRLWKFRFQMFSDAQKTDLDYFGIMSKKILLESLATDKNTFHWLHNGLKTYWEIRYLKQFYPNTLLLGNLPNHIRFLGIKPLNGFNISKKKLTERYGLAYQYMVSQNLDQKIATAFSDLSNFNQITISQMETGLLLDYLAEKTGVESFDTFIKNYVEKHRNQIVDGSDFLDQLAIHTHYSSSFLEDHFKHNSRLNFKIRKTKKTENGYLVTIEKNSHYGLPIKLTIHKESEKLQTFWFDTSENQFQNQFLIPEATIKKIQLNDGYIFPETHYRDNYRYTSGIFTNTKKIKLKLLKDIPDPEFHEIYTSLRVNFNAYDKILFGLNFQNASMLPPPFVYSITPYYSTGTRQVTGSGSIGYSLRPVNTFFRSWDFGISASHFHYDYDLSYSKFSAFSKVHFAKRLRSDINRSLMLSYNYFQKDLTPNTETSEEYQRYNIWNLNYGFSDSKIIHEKAMANQIQIMKDFQKISSELFYRWEFSKNKKMSFRLFVGAFLSNKSKGDWFNFGISRVSNYAFSYSLLGQSSTSGILSQQYIAAEGGFKSLVGTSANQWLSSVGIDTHLWKMLNIYADAGFYKNKGDRSRFIWDSGIKLKIIPDFLEIYFPLQSSLGFEPLFKDYSKRIRYTIIFNLGAFTNYFRRGWF